MPFPNHVREDALVKAQRRCCVCHEFAGRSINVHHIVQEADGGPNDLENAIVLCLRCHAEAGHYNPRHPLGTKYSPSELVKHRNAWFSSCANGTAQFSSSVEARVQRTLNTAELHKYVLLFTFRNGNKHVVQGWRLDIFLPEYFSVTQGEGCEELEETIDGVVYRKFHFSGGQSHPIYLGESVELTDPEFECLEYAVDDELHDAAHGTTFKILWRFYSSVEPPVLGELNWEEIQQF